MIAPEDRSQINAPVWNSSFKIIEAPMSYMNKLLNTHKRLFERIFSPAPSVSSSPPGHELKNECVLWTVGRHIYHMRITIIATVGQVIAYPVSWVFTPVTIITDIFAGVVQASLEAAQGASKEAILSILHKKVIASPAQQIAYTVNNIYPFLKIFGPALAQLVITVGLISVSAFTSKGLPVSTGIASAATILPSAGFKVVVPGILLHSFFVGDKLYRDAQTMVSKLPKFLIPDNYNIFIEDGALDGLGNKYFDPEGVFAKFKKEFESRRNARSNSDSKTGSSHNDENRPYSSKAKDLIKGDLEQVKEEADSLKELHDWFESNIEPFTLFGFKSEDDVTAEKLKKSFNQWSLICHPDKCSESKGEAAILFRMLSLARLDVEQRIISKKK